jgi:uncharacterized BrkB/YihY/UPF0761 family membrane protein
LSISLQSRILTALKFLLIGFPIALILKLAIGYKEINILSSFFILFGISIGASFSDVFYLVYKKSANEKSENERLSCSILSLIMGIIGIPSFPILIASIIGIIYAIPGVKASKSKLAIAGIVLSSVGLLLAVIFYASCLYAQIKKA